MEFRKSLLLFFSILILIPTTNGYLLAAGPEYQTTGEYPELCTLSGDNWVLVRYVRNEDKIYSDIFNGINVTNTYEIASGTGDECWVQVDSISPSEFIVVWLTNATGLRQVWGRYCTLSGCNNPFRIDNGTLLDYHKPKVASVGDTGKIFVGWQHENDLYGRVMYLTGSNITNQFLISSSFRDRFEVDVILLSFVWRWVLVFDNENDNTYMIQGFTNGTFSVPQLIQTDSYDPDIRIRNDNISVAVMLGSGRLEYSVRDASNNIKAGPFAVAGQWAPQLTLLSSGIAVVLWADGDSLPYWEQYMQSLYPNGTAYWTQEVREHTKDGSLSDYGGVPYGFIEALQTGSTLDSFVGIWATTESGTPTINYKIFNLNLTEWNAPATTFASTSPNPSAVASASPNPSASASVSPNGTQGDSGTRNTPKSGMVAGAVVAVIAGLGLAAALILLVVKKRKKNNKKEDDNESSMELKKNPAKREGSQDSVEVERNSAEISTTDADKGWKIPYSDITLAQELGRGAFGIVYQCIWRNTDCVIKLLNVNADNKHAVKLFLREASTVRNMRNHPNICSIMGICTNPVAIVMEYVSGGSLLHCLASKQVVLDVPKIIKFAKDVASGMSHLHAESIIHLDLACRNLLVAFGKDDSQQLKITDFGLSRLMDADTYTASEDATFPIRWTAPETLTMRLITRASDVWSFGVTVWEMIEGRTPYFDIPTPLVLDAVSKGGRLSRPSKVPIPDTLWNLITSCWHENYKERPTFDQICLILKTMDTETGGVSDDPPPSPEYEAQYGNAPQKQQTIYDHQYQ